MARLIRVLLADDHTRSRRALRAYLATQNDIAVVGEASNGFEAVALAEALRPDVVVMDVEMPELNGIAATQTISRSGYAEVIGHSMSAEGGERMLIAGARDFVLKAEGPERLLAALRATALGR